MGGNFGKGSSGCYKEFCGFKFCGNSGHGYVMHMVSLSILRDRKMEHFSVESCMRGYHVCN